MSRVSRDEYINPLGAKIMLPDNGNAREFIQQHGLKLYNGFDYDRQVWIHKGHEDTRPLEVLKRAISAGRCDCALCPENHR